MIATLQGNSKLSVARVRKALRVWVLGTRPRMTIYLEGAI
jgi:hypothetical protein